MYARFFMLVFGALLVYAGVLRAHAERHRSGPVHFYALMGGLAAIVSWVSDAGVQLNLGWLTFNIGSTIFYTALMLGVFVIYVFEGPRITQALIFAVTSVLVIMPVTALLLHLQNDLLGHAPLTLIPMPDWRINLASVTATLLDLVFLCVVWEFLGTPALNIKLHLRTFLTLLGVMWLDVLLFTAGAFWGTPAFSGILAGSMMSRFMITLLAFPMLYAYIQQQSRRPDVTMANRPILAILRQMATISEELNQAQQEIARRKAAEEALHQALSDVKTLRGFIPICAGCKKVRDDKGYWEQIESYVRRHSEAQFSHGLCPDCIKTYYPLLEPHTPTTIPSANPGPDEINREGAL